MNGGAGGMGLGAMTFSRSVTAPVIVSASPSTSTQLGLTTFTITGRNFVAGCTVKIGGTACTGVVFGSSTSVTAMAPPKAAGTYDLLVTNPSGETSDTSGAGLWHVTSTPTPQATLGSRLKRLYVTSSIDGGGTRTWVDVIAGDNLTEGDFPASTLTPKKDPAVQALPDAGGGNLYDSAGSIGGATYRNMIIFGAFKIPPDINCPLDDFTVFFNPQCWNCYIVNTSGKLEFYGGPDADVSGLADSNADLRDATWHYFVGHYTNDGASLGVGRLFLDGVLQTLHQDAGGNVVPTTGTSVGFYQGTGSPVECSLIGVALGGAGVPITDPEVASIGQFLADWM